VLGAFTFSNPGDPKSPKYPKWIIPWVNYLWHLWLLTCSPMGELLMASMVTNMFPLQKTADVPPKSDLLHGRVDVLRHLSRGATHVEVALLLQHALVDGLTRLTVSSDSRCNFQ